MNRHRAFHCFLVLLLAMGFLAQTMGQRRKPPPKPLKPKYFKEYRPKPPVPYKPNGGFDKPYPFHIAPEPRAEIPPAIHVELERLEPSKRDGLRGVLCGNPEAASYLGDLPEAVRKSFLAEMGQIYDAKNPLSSEFLELELPAAARRAWIEYSGLPKEIHATLRAQPHGRLDHLRDLFHLDPALPVLLAALPPSAQRNVVADYFFKELVELPGTAPSIPSMQLPGMASHRPDGLESYLSRIQPVHKPDPESFRTITECYRSSLEKLLPPDWSGLAEQVARSLGSAVVTIAERPEKGPRTITFSVARPEGTVTHTVKIPRWEFLGLEKGVVAKRFAARLGDLPKGVPVLFTSGDRDFLTHELMPGILSARAFDPSLRYAKEHIENIRDLSSRTLDPQSAVLVNLLPQSEEECRSMGLPGASKRWREARSLYTDAATRHGVEQMSGPAKKDLLELLESGQKDTIIIAGHGTPRSIVLPDGTQVTVDDIEALGPPPSGRKPLVILLACETGRTERGVQCIAQALLRKGRACGVIAPTRKIPALDPTVKVLEKILEGGPENVPEAVLLLQGPWQLFAERGPNSSKSAFSDRITDLLHVGLPNA